MRLKRIAALFLSLSLMLTSGCWDMVEIEKRAIVGAVIIDLIEKNEENEEKEESKEASPFCEDKPKRLKVTFGLNNPSKLQEGGEGAAIFVSVEAANIPDAVEAFGERISRIPFYGHTRLIAITDKLVKDKDIFKEIVDEFERKAIINQQTKIVVLKGNPENIEKVDTKLENLYSSYITGILENSKVLSSTVSMTLHELVIELRNNDGAAAIPVLETDTEKQKVFIIDKLALIKDYKLLSILDSKYIKTYKLVKGDLINARKLITYKDIMLPYFIFTADRKIWLEEDEETLKFRVKVMLEGDIEQFQFEKNLFDSKVITDVEKSIDESIVKELDVTTKHFQRDIGYDYLGFKEYTSKYHNRVFKKYEDNWDEAFINAKIVYEVEAKVRRIGTSKE